MRVIDLTVVQRHRFDNGSRKLDILDDLTLAHAVQNPFSRDVNNFVRSSYDKESTNPPKDSMVVFLMGQIAFLRDETKLRIILFNVC